MKPRKKYKPKGIRGVDEKITYESVEELEKDSGRNRWDFDDESSSEENLERDGEGTSKVDEDIMKRKNVKNKKKYSYFGVTLYTVLIGSILFFLISMGVAVYVFFSGGIFVSPENIKIVIEGQEKVSAGGSVNLEIKIKNENSVSLLGSSLVLRYPNGARNPENLSSRMLTERIDMGLIRADESKEVKVNFNLFGQEGEEHTFSVSLEYSIEGSNAVFTRTESLPITIEDTSISLDIKGPDKVYINSREEYTVLVESVSDEAQENVVIHLNHPLNFYLFDSSEDFSRGSWRIKTLSPREVKEITFIGMFSEFSEMEENRTLSISAGPADDTVTHIAVSSVMVEIDDKAFDLEISLGRNDVVPSGDFVEGELTWYNHARFDIDRYSLRLFFEGDNVSDFSGRSATRESGSLFWNENSLRLSGAGGVIPIYFKTSFLDRTSDRDFVLRAQLEGQTFRGDNFMAEDFQKFTISTPVAVEILSDFDEDESFFKKGKKFKTSLTLKVVSGAGDILEANIIGALPKNVSVENIIAGKEMIEFNDEGDFVWGIGNIDAGTGLWRPDREVVLIVVIVPEEDKKAPHIMEFIRFIGKDRLTDRSIQKTLPVVDVYGTGYSELTRSLRD